MKKIGLLIGLLAAGMQYAQITFEKGYFINNAGERTEASIKNLDWKNNPTEFEYKLDNSSDVRKENIKNIQEFGIETLERYVRKTILIDRSSDHLNRLSETRAPEFKEETLFLKYLVEGKSNLFYYESGDTRRFFYSTDDGSVKQLIYKSYAINESQIGYNEEYKKQLSESLKCGVDSKMIKKTDYEPTDLTKIFITNNECSTGHTVLYGQAKVKKDLFNLTIRPGVNFSKVENNHHYYSVNDQTKFDSKATFRIGAELEFILPFNKNKWALFAEPTYQYYKNTTEVSLMDGSYNGKKSKRSVDYKSFEIPFGIRHYFFINKQSKIFVNAAYILDFNLNSAITYDQTEFKIASGNNFTFGAGYKYNDKYSLEFRMGMSRDLLRNYLNFASNYRTISVILGYTLF
ncbi:porin family protein [Chryseobacterium soli]|nr:hypothetical protein [Chryseobacterium soli]